MTSTLAIEAIREIVAANVRRLRLAKEVSQEQLAALAGFHRTYVSQIERCVTNISVDNVARLAAVLEVEAWVLMRPTDDWRQARDPLDAAPLGPDSLASTELEPSSRQNTVKSPRAKK